MVKMHLISAEGYKNGGIQFLKVQETGEIWASMKDSGSSMGVKNISDLILKKYTGYLKQKTLQKSKLRNTKWQKEKFMKSLII